jgi:hypothetical protein
MEAADRQIRSLPTRSYLEFPRRRMAEVLRVLKKVFARQEMV